MKKAYILYGISASGKTTRANEILKSQPAVYINRDTVRRQQLNLEETDNLWSSYSFNKDLESKVTTICDKLLGEAVKEEKDIVVDNTHLNLRQRDELSFNLMKKGYIVSLINTTTTDKLSFYINNNKARRDSLSSGVINDQFIKQCINKDVDQSIFLPVRIALVDIDGTIAHNDGHRSYFDYINVDKDLPIQHTIEVVKALYETNRIDYIQFLSGRDSSCYDLTLKWLEQQGFDMNTHNLFMRLKDDRRKDYIVKKEILDNCLINKKIEYVFDDRNQIVDLWHDLKLPVFNVGDYRERF